MEVLVETDGGLCGGKRLEKNSGRREELMREMKWGRGSRLGNNSGNRAELIKEIPDRCGGKIRLAKKTGGKMEQWKKLTAYPAKPKKHTNTHTLVLGFQLDA